MPESKLSPKQIAQLGGFASTRKRGSAEMAAAGAKGGKTTAERYGREHFIRAAHKRWGRLKTKESQTPEGDDAA